MSPLGRRQHQQVVDSIEPFALLVVEHPLMTEEQVERLQDEAAW